MRTLEQIAALATSQRAGSMRPGTLSPPQPSVRCVLNLRRHVAPRRRPARYCAHFGLGEGCGCGAPCAPPPFSHTGRARRTRAPGTGHQTHSSYVMLPYLLPALAGPLFRLGARPVTSPFVVLPPALSLGTPSRPLAGHTLPPSRWAHKKRGAEDAREAAFVGEIAQANNRGRPMMNAIPYVNGIRPHPYSFPSAQQPATQTPKG